MQLMICWWTEEEKQLITGSSLIRRLFISIRPHLNKMLPLLLKQPNLRSNFLSACFTKFRMLVVVVTISEPSGNLLLALPRHFLQDAKFMYSPKKIYSATAAAAAACVMHRLICTAKQFVTYNFGGGVYSAAFLFLFTSYFCAVWLCWMLTGVVRRCIVGNCEEIICVRRRLRWHCF